MATKLVNVTNATGLHARPAADFTKMANACVCEVSLEKDGKKVNAKSILGILSLGIVKGSQVTIITEGEGEAEALAKLVDFVENLEE